MKVFRIILITVLCVFFLFCSDKKNQNIKITGKAKIEVPKYVKMNSNKKLTDSLFSLAIDKGDKKAYNNVASNYILDANYEDLLYYSIIMVNKYNNSEAHFHIFFNFK